MHRGRRWAFNLLTDFSLIVALGVAASWAASEARGVLVGRLNAGATAWRAVCVYRGQVNLYSNRSNRADQKTEPTLYGCRSWVFRRGEGTIECKHNFIGFGWEAPDSTPDPVHFDVAVPHWFLLLLAAALPALRLARFIRRRRKIASGHCAICGYDLRATPDRCPECGTVNQAATPAGESAAGIPKG